MMKERLSGIVDQENDVLINDHDDNRKKLSPLKIADRLVKNPIPNNQNQETNFGFLSPSQKNKMLLNRQSTNCSSNKDLAKCLNVKMNKISNNNHEPFSQMSNKILNLSGNDQNVSSDSKSNSKSGSCVRQSKSSYDDEENDENSKDSNSFIGYINNLNPIKDNVIHKNNSGSSIL